MAVYAVKIGGRWWVAHKAKARDYRLEKPDADVWSEVGTTALLGYVGDGDRFVELEVSQ